MAKPQSPHVEAPRSSDGALVVKNPSPESSDTGNERDVVPSLKSLLTTKDASGPLKLSIKQLHDASDESFHAFIAALEVDTSLAALGFRSSTRFLSPPRSLVFLGAVARNRGLQCLDLKYCRMADNEWEHFWEFLSGHPTIHFINVKNTWPMEACDKRKRDRVMAKSIGKSTVLTELEYSKQHHNPKIMKEEIFPVLELNRLRHHLQAIQSEESALVRDRVFTQTLLHDRVRDRPALLYLLLKGNPDFLVQCIRSGKNCNNIKSDGCFFNSCSMFG